MFTTSVGTGYESHNLRRDFRRVTVAAGLGARWVPKWVDACAAAGWRGTPAAKEEVPVRNGLGRVVRELACPASRAISSTGTPW